MFLRRFKWLILILTGLTFIYLVAFNFHTINDHRDFSVYLQKLRLISDKLVQIGWDDTTVTQWRRSLEIHGNSEQAVCNLPNNIIVAMPGDSLQDYLWEYISLLMLRERWKRSNESLNISLGVFLAPKAKKALAEVLEKVHMDSVEDFPSSCLDFKHAHILGHTNNVEMVRHSPTLPRLFLLESSAKRYMEVIYGDLPWLRRTVVLRKGLQEGAKKKMSSLKKSFGRNGTHHSGVFFVGLHFGPHHIPLSVPVDAYRAAVQSVELWDKNAALLVLCPKNHMEFCRENFEDDTRVRILPAGDQQHTLALLMLCRGNIIRSDLSFIAAILNGDGTTFVLQSSASESDPAATVGHFMPNWIMLEN